jgi:hypothetical protein
VSFALFRRTDPPTTLNYFFQLYFDYLLLMSLGL